MVFFNFLMQNLGTGPLHDRLKDINKILDNKTLILQSASMNSKDCSEIYWINEPKFFPMPKHVCSKSSAFSRKQKYDLILTWNFMPMTSHVPQFFEEFLSHESGVACYTIFALCVTLCSEWWCYALSYILCGQLVSLVDSEWVSCMQRKHNRK